MEYMTGELNDGTTPYSAFKENEGKVISIKGAIHNIRDMSDFAFGARSYSVRVFARIF